MGMETTLKNSVMIAIFVIAIITFSVNFAIDNDSDILFTDGDDRYSDLTDTLDENIITFQENAETSQDILDATSLVSGDTEISGSGGQFKVGPFTAIGMTITSLSASFKNIFGVEFYFILAMFSALFTFLIGYYVIKAWLGRDPN